MPNIEKNLKHGPHEVSPSISRKPLGVIYDQKHTFFNMISSINKCD